MHYQTQTSVSPILTSKFDFENVTKYDGKFWKNCYCPLISADFCISKASYFVTFSNFPLLILCCIKMWRNLMHPTLKGEILKMWRNMMLHYSKKIALKTFKYDTNSLKFGHIFWKCDKIWCYTIKKICTN